MTAVELHVDKQASSSVHTDATSSAADATAQTPSSPATAEVVLQLCWTDDIALWPYRCVTPHRLFIHIATTRDGVVTV